jgi:malonyl-CoA O-methyltransferase
MTAPITVTNPPPALPTKQRIRQAFDQAATGYDAAADVQREMADRLAAHLSPAGLDREPAAILDAGCGTGHGARELARRWPRTQLALLDFAPAMLAIARVQLPGATVICADIEALPFGDGGFGGYWSSLTWQWNDPRRCLAEAARVLEPGGWLAVATLGADNFPELRHAFTGADAYSHILTMPPPEQLLAECRATGWTVRVWERRAVRRHFADARGALRSVKAVGAHEVEQRRPTPLSRGAWRAINDRYEQLREAGGLPLTYDGVWLIATRP